MFSQGCGTRLHTDLAKTYSMCLQQEILNHCFDDVERFMGRLQQTAEAQTVLNQRRKTRSRKSKKKGNQDGEKIGAPLSELTTVVLVLQGWSREM